MSQDAPALVVVGAALGTGRWLAEHLLPHAPWSSVTLVDSKTTRTRLAGQGWRLRDPVFGESIETPEGDRVVVEGGTAPLPLPTGPTVVWFALPPTVLENALAELLPLLDPAATVVVSASPLGPVLTAARSVAAGRAVHGVHPLFDASMPSLAGQILYVVPDRDVPGWLADAVHHAGGLLKTGTAPEHDAAMAIVQNLAHRTLVDFAAAVTGSGLDLEHELWEARTPLFETLLGLAVRVLDSRTTTAPGDELAAIQDRFPGALFDTVRGTAAAAVTAAQAKRLAFAALWRSAELVGIRRSGERAGGGRATPRAGRRAEHPVVGRIVDLTPTTVTIENVLLGPITGGVLLTGPGAANAAALGIGGSPRRVAFALSHAEPITGDALDALLDERLATIRRDVRFLVPESVAGDGVLQVVRVARGLRSAELRDEVVRTGQRAVVIRLEVRADHDPAAVIATLQQRVAEAYRWPAGLALTVEGPISRVAYLGPAGTFSEDAAGLAAIAVGAPEAALDALGSFEEVLTAIGARGRAAEGEAADALPAGGGTVGVLPITSSASGLVSRSVAALLAAPGRVVAGGMVDVAVRFDAYARPGTTAESLRGAPVYAHPQSFAQCGAFVRRLGLVAVPCESNAAALHRAADSETPAVALAGPAKAGALPLVTIEREVDDLSGSITRFLVLGAPETFGDFRSGSQPTLRRLWIGAERDAALGLLGTGAGLDELLSDADGRWLLVSSGTGAASAAAGGEAPGMPGARLLGDVPWSPRTPVVRPAP